jgi:hypothetical protein
MEEPLTRYGVTAVFHGHAHRGSLEGKIGNGIPVYNVALPLLKERRPNEPPFRVLEVTVGEPAGREDDRVVERRRIGRRTDDRASANG